LLPEAYKPHVLLVIVILGVLVGVSWSFHRRRKLLHRLLMTACACLGIWTFTLFGAVHDHGVFGHQNFHAHDFYHYYFGSKYLHEWGYGDMYLATVAALEEIGREEPRKAISFERIRDLRGSARFLYRNEFLPLTDVAKARFSPERWRNLKADLSFLRDKTPDNGWWRGVMLDNGFNPPPSYAVIGGFFSNRIPFNEHTWKWLGGLDFLLLGIGVGAICYAIGWIPGLFTLVILGNAPITTYNWTGGSFLRQVWLFFLMIGLASLARRRWYAAGAALGACTATVLFPAFFLFGALAPLGYRRYRTPRDVALFRVAVGAAAAIATLVVLSVLLYGAGAWSEWNHRIAAHGVTFFDNHIGLKKILTFAPEVGGQAFGAGDSVYPEWNRALVARGDRGHAVDVVLALLLSVAMIAGALRARPAEASLVIGSGLLAVWTMPAGYYTAYIGVFAAFMLANRSSSYSRARFAVVSVALIWALLMARFEHDLIPQMFWLSVGWILCILILCALYWYERPAISQTLLQRRRTIAAVSSAVVLLLLGSLVPRNWPHDAAFLPAPILRGSRVVDILDVGPNKAEQSHHFDIGETLRVPRNRIDTFGYRISDECGILRSGRVLHYELAPSPHGGRLVIRTDAFYRGDLLTTVNGRPLPSVPLDPHQTLFAYLEIPLPGDLGDGPLQVEQSTTATDIGIFTVWLLDP
jgi:hypothetical protein